MSGVLERGDERKTGTGSAIRKTNKKSM
jgi:hypothetical protein